jgi:membrane dipeptidase
MYKKIQPLPFILLIFIVFFLFQTGCRSKVPEESLASRARGIHDRVLTVDTHCDTPSRLVGGDWDIGVRHEPGLRGSGKIDLPRMAEGGLDAEFFAVFVGQDKRTEPGYAEAKKSALQTLEAIHAMCDKYPDLVGLALTPEDAYRLEKEGRRAAFIGMENGYPVGRTLSNLEEYYNLGVRYVTLCHSRDNDICDSSTDRQDPEDHGLSEFGREVVAACNRLGMMVDISHASDQSFYDVIHATRAPIIASHSSCRDLCASPRNLSDDMIRALAGNGGVIQICFLSSYVRTPEPNPERDQAFQELRAKYGARRDIRDEAVRKKAMEEFVALNERYPEEKATVAELVDHIEHVIKLVGIDYVGIGTDFDGGGGVEGCNDVSEMFRVTEELVRRGRREQEIAKIWGGNIMRVFRRVIAVSRELSSRDTPLNPGAIAE